MNLRPPGPEPRKSNSKCFIWCRLGASEPFFLSLSCTEVVPNWTRSEATSGTRHRLTGSGPRNRYLGSQLLFYVVAKPGRCLAQHCRLGCASRKPQDGNCTFYPNSPPMLIFLATLLGTLSSMLHSRVALEIENLALRHPGNAPRQNARN